MKQRQVLDNSTLLALDDIQHLCFDQRQCLHGLIKRHSTGKETRRYHQLLAAVWAQPGKKTVFPVAVERITRPDGATKNGCEQNAAKRLIPQIRTVFPHRAPLAYLRCCVCQRPRNRIARAKGPILHPRHQRKLCTQARPTKWKK